MSINLKALREAETRATKNWKAVTNSDGDPEVPGGSRFWEELYLETDADVCLACLARNEMPKLLDWIERASEILAEGACPSLRIRSGVEDDYHEDCYGCESRKLLADLEEQDK